MILFSKLKQLQEHALKRFNYSIILVWVNSDNLSHYYWRKTSEQHNKIIKIVT
jgi:hypothetical protein